MRAIRFTCFFIFLSFSIGISSQSIWNRKHLEEVREHIHALPYSIAYRQLKKDADLLLTKTPVSVMDKQKTAVSGDKHDYMSQARYYWPNPKKANGLPYISLDGQSNPEIYELDRERLGEMTSRIVTLSLTWFFSRDERYAIKAREQIYTWFFNKETLMNPHFKYAQIVRGENNDKGRSYGLIDGYSFIEMLDAVQLLESSKCFTRQDSQKLKRWFSLFLKWYIESSQGRKENRAANNHSLAYHVQVTAFALYCGNKKLVEKYIRMFPEARVFKQTEPDGRQPQELRRTLAYGYSEFNIRHMIDMFMLAKNYGLNIDRATSTDGRSFYKAVDFLIPYLGEPVSQWPYKQISEWDEKQQDFCKDLYLSYILDPERKDYLKLFHKFSRVKDSDRWNLLYYDYQDINENPMSFIDNQLRILLRNTQKAILLSNNKSLVSPRTINKDGSLRMVTSRDWCSGFFPGLLWMMYQYNGNEFWRKQATIQTLLLEDLKNYAGTHDLGFMIHNSFGKGWMLTHDNKFLNVELQSAKALSSRFNAKVGCIRSWDHHKDRWTFPVIIDNMMNLEFLFWATQQTGDSIYYKEAVSHAKVTMKNHFRSDYSSYHVIDYDSVSGLINQKCTFQGLADESIWSRGQSWGLYGFTLCYRYTHDKEFLDQAEKIANFIFSQHNMPSDFIPYWDMKDPSIPNAPRDVSSAAITASALYELCSYSAKRIQYKAWADQIIYHLSKEYRCPAGKKYGFLLLHSTGNYPSHDEIDVPIIYADYYYVEALLRKLKLENG